MTQFQEYAEVLPKDLLQRAYNTGAELAWSRQDTVTAISLLMSAGFVVVGVEVWIPTNPGPTMTGRGWTLSKASSPNSATEFVNSFQWGGDSKLLGGAEPYFNLTAVKDAAPDAGARQGRA
jgi:hypothetical protein